MTKQKEPSTYERVKMFYHVIKLMYFNDERFIGKHITDVPDKKEAIREFTDYIFTRYREVPEVHVGYKINHHEQKELYVWAQVNHNWERTVFGKVKEQGSSGSGGRAYLQQVQETQDEEQALQDNLEGIAQFIYDSMDRNDDGKPVKYQLYNGSSAPLISNEQIPQDGKRMIIKPTPINSFPAPSFHN